MNNGSPKQAKTAQPKPIPAPPVAKPTRLKATPIRTTPQPTWKQIPWQAYALGGFVLVAWLIYVNRPQRRPHIPTVAATTQGAPPAPRREFVSAPQTVPVAPSFRSVEMSRAVPPVAIIQEPDPIVSTVVPEPTATRSLSDWDALVDWKLTGFAQTPGEPAVDAVLHIKQVDMTKQTVDVLLELPEQPLQNRTYSGTIGKIADTLILKNNGSRYVNQPGLKFLTARSITLTWSGQQLSGTGANARWEFSIPPEWAPTAAPPETFRGKRTPLEVWESLVGQPLEGISMIPNHPAWNVRLTITAVKFSGSIVEARMELIGNPRGAMRVTGIIRPQHHYSLLLKLQRPGPSKENVRAWHSALNHYCGDVQLRVDDDGVIRGISRLETFEFRIKQPAQRQENAAIERPAAAEPVSDDQQAERMLVTVRSAIKQAKSQGSYATSRQFISTKLQEIIRKYPETPAAKEAKRLLEEDGGK